MIRLKKIVAIAITAIAIQTPLLAAETDFFKDKRITYIVATNAGGV